MKLSNQDQRIDEILSELKSIERKTNIFVSFFLLLLGSLFLLTALCTPNDAFAGGKKSRFGDVTITDLSAEHEAREQRELQEEQRRLEQEQARAAREADMRLAQARASRARVALPTAQSAMIPVNNLVNQVQAMPVVMYQLVPVYVCPMCEVHNLLQE